MAVYNLIAKIVGNFGGDTENRAFTSDVKEQLFHNGYVCSYCNNTILNIDDAEVDHVLPFSQGGRTEISNAQLLHRHCNRKKNDTIINPDNIEDWENIEENIG
jgi:5-methylcytosine-specific restriction endonuclease McrA